MVILMSFQRNKRSCYVFQIGYRGIDSLISFRYMEHKFQRHLTHLFSALLFQF